MTKTERYLHYGNPVEYSYGKELYENMVEVADGECILLPIKEKDVYRYKIGNKTKYTILVLDNKNSMDSHGYTFDKMPDDLNINLLVSDIDSQRNGKSPLVMPTKCGMLLKETLKNARKRIDRNQMSEPEKSIYNSLLLSKIDNEVKDNVYDKMESAKIKMSWIIASTVLNMAGYGREYFEKNDTGDIREEDLIKLNEEFAEYERWERERED